jgi:hypothetical protein
MYSVGIILSELAARASPYEQEMDFLTIDGIRIIMQIKKYDPPTAVVLSFTTALLIDIV